MTNATQLAPKIDNTWEAITGRFTPVTNKFGKGSYQAIRHDVEYWKVTPEPNNTFSDGNQDVLVSFIIPLSDVVSQSKTVYFLMKKNEFLAAFELPAG